MATHASHEVKFFVVQTHFLRKMELNKKKKPRNATDGDENAIVLFTGVHCARCIGAQKNTCAYRLKHVKKLNMKYLMLSDSDDNVTTTRNKKHLTNKHGTAGSMHLETNGGMITSKQKCCVTDVGEH